MMGHDHAQTTDLAVDTNWEPFCPPFFLKPPAIQTFLASSGLRALGGNPMVAAARETILSTEDGVRLLGYMSRHSRPHQKGLVILIHGWKGSSDSTYIRTTGRFLFDCGFDVFRLNLRDHGPSHHLNTGMFYAVLLDEVLDAVRQVAEKGYPNPVFLAGFSLGGNFTLRIARRCATLPIEGLKQVVSISPVLDPEKSTDHIDKTRFIRHYFLKKWRRSLKIKQKRFPDRYDFSSIMQLDSIREMTERLLARYSEYDNAKAYFNDYTITDSDIGKICVPTTIITARDDPIIPIGDFYRLGVNKAVRLMVQPHGGHNGFVNGRRLSGWYEKVMAAMFTANRNARDSFSTEF